ncbi:molybdenum cofactor guanylyltransferase [Hydromonas duriensis]|uniref:Molybdenum cofactor guanylyltransferase n=1 Tax=Hydromonas duriensis TaxID=1527608 RepID=A0A4R6YAZ0_9BURK|nr:molybdenum cofactor guanylyltransferase [Hydromonas duriensis]TDR32773.1 molybdenum cofactor guanylyltransferase [Hydromonas duriensis]
MTMIGVVLAGGRSSRMGRDKAHLQREDGRTWLEFSKDTLRQINCEAIFISGRNDENGIPDRQIHAGPAAALVDAYAHICTRCPNTTLIVFIPVDLPFLSANTLKILVQASANVDLANFTHHPLPLAIKVTPKISAHLQALPHVQNMSMRQLAKALHHVQVPCTIAIEHSLTNVNAIEELKRLHHENQN